MKHRKNKVKREHGLIPNALGWLEHLSSLAEVTDIIPGVIDVNHSPERGIVYKYETKTGCKLLLKSNGSIQEVFVVTQNPSAVQTWVRREFPQEGSESALRTEFPQRVETSKRKSSAGSVKNERSASVRFNRAKKKSSPQTVANKTRSSKRGKTMTLKSFQKNAAPETTQIADVLDRTTFKKLNLLKQSLKSHKEAKPRH
ncbi:DUF2103 domain-containing protein [Desulfosporosinus sp. PR]|uniref:DUF2103 domain-containing protein n=1 Tax=Candidatus Desulfosporosinus nitrosoreducens TaxID=3401928 RepID=UPI0027F51375|nr:DUF2103 domain-containing protein [Desulfosporosinus sp. PR]MDQ7093947.1 DUF2103 domain-containing protein [Desulfosporosinus sp. PR]